MTTIQIQALKHLHEATTTQAPDAPSMKATQMALQSHNLDKAGDVATLPNGQRWAWRTTGNRWVLIADKA